MGKNLKPAGGSEKRKKKIFAISMSAPTVLLLVVMSIFPLAFTAYYSLTNYNYLAAGSAKFIGFKNFINLFQNKYFLQSIWNTVKFTIVCVLLETVIGLALAVFIHGIRRGKKALRTIVILPYLIPPVTVALIWQIMLSSNYGIINGVLSALHLPVYNWFYDIKSAFATICFIEIWQCMPFVFLLLYAALQSIPETLYEAAQLDGASRWKQFLHITLPSIKNNIFLCVLMRTVDTFRLFDKINILTKGGPANSTATITQFLYNNGIKNLQFGNGSAIAVVMVILVLLLSSAYIKQAMPKNK